MEIVKKGTAIKDKIVLEMIAYWINVAYLTIFFAVFTSYRRIILAGYNINYDNWGISLIKALVLSKVIMVGSMLRFGRSLESKPLIIPTLYKTFAFTLWVIAFTAVESAVRGFLGKKGLEGAFDYLLSEGTNEFFAKCLVVFCAFIPFFAFKELGRVLGKGKIWDLFFSRKKDVNGMRQDAASTSA
jgi:hypothetical protein